MSWQGSRCSGCRFYCDDKCEFDYAFGYNDALKARGYEGSSVLTPEGQRVWPRIRLWLTWGSIVVAFVVGICIGRLS